jgi:hypothetical protein
MPDALDQIAREIRRGHPCPLAGRAGLPVPGEGPADARIFVIGQAPGVVLRLHVDEHATCSPKRWAPDDEIDETKRTGSRREEPSIRRLVPGGLPACFPSFLLRLGWVAPLR